jgi:arginase family enzyme
MDALDPSYAPGVATPEPYGLRDIDLLEIIKCTAPYTVGIDIVEVCPSYDNGNASMLAAKLAREYISWRHKILNHL